MANFSPQGRFFKMIFLGAALCGAASFSGCKQTAGLPPGPEPDLNRKPVEPLHLVQESPVMSPGGDTPPSAKKDGGAPPASTLPENLDQWKAPALSAKSAAETSAVYGEKCAPCHGEKGKGDGPMVDRLPEGAPDLTRKTTQALSDGVLLKVITEGRLNTGKMMPGFASLDTPTRQRLVRYLRQLGQPGAEKKPDGR